MHNFQSTSKNNFVVFYLNLMSIFYIQTIKCYTVGNNENQLNSIERESNNLLILENRTLIFFSYSALFLIP